MSKVFNEISFVIEGEEDIIVNDDISKLNLAISALLYSVATLFDA